MPVSDYINGTELVDKPWETVFSPYTDLFASILGVGLGNGAFLIPISFIGAALFWKSKSPVTVGMYLITTGALLSGGGLFTGMTQMILVYIIVVAMGIGSLFVGIFLRR